MNRLELAQVVERADGVAPFNEASRLALADGRTPRWESVVSDDGSPIALALAVDSAPVELAVHPDHRRQGHGTALLGEALADGERLFWSHGDLPGARMLAAAHDLAPARTLLHLAMPLTAVPASAPVPGITIRRYRDDDQEALLAVNAAAFASHPDQGALSADGFIRITQEPWFEPAGVLIAEDNGTLVGFHWTKRVGQSGEIYVLGVAPGSEGRGIGRLLALCGLDHLASTGATEVMLYVESDNAAALSLYESLGFSERSRDVMYVSRTPEATGLGQS